MSLMPRYPDGYYDEHGNWQRTKFCFVDCGASCTCKPPLGRYYSAEHQVIDGPTPACERCGGSGLITNIHGEPDDCQCVKGVFRRD